MTIDQLLAKHVDILQLAFSVDPETGARDMHVWLADHYAGHVHDDPHLWQSTSCDSAALTDPVMRADVSAFYDGIESADNAIWFRTVEAA